MCSNYDYQFLIYPHRIDNTKSELTKVGTNVKNADKIDILNKFDQ